MLIGSNNSLTYLEPSNTWLKYFSRLGKYQNKDYDVQYTFYGVRLFDLRLFVDNNNRIIVKNGIYEYPIFSLYEILDYLNKREDAIVYITLDEPKKHYTEDRMKVIEKRFIDFCYIIETIYENLRLCGGYRRSDGKQLYSFDWEKKNKKPTLVNPNEWSRTYRIVSKWCPMLLKYLNRKLIKRFDDKSGYLVLNYVNYK